MSSPPHQQWQPSDAQKAICQLKDPVGWRRACITWFKQLPIELSLKINDHLEVTDCEPAASIIYRMVGYGDYWQKDRILDAIFQFDVTSRLPEHLWPQPETWDFDIICVMLYFTGCLEKVVPTSYRDDERTVALSLCSPFDGSIRYVSERLQSDRQFLINLLPLTRKGSGILKFVAEPLKDDREVVVAALNQKGVITPRLQPSFRWASARLREDCELVELAIRSDNDGSAFQYAGETARKDRTLLQSLSADFPSILIHVPDLDVTRDLGIILQALRRDGRLVVDLPPTVRDHLDCIVAATHSWMCAYRYASDRLRSDLEAAKQVAQVNGLAVRFAAEELRNDWNLGWIAVQNNTFSLEDLSTQLKDNYEMVTYCMQRYGGLIQYASRRLQNHEEIIMTAIQTFPYAIQYTETHHPLRNEPQFMQTIIEKDWGLLQYASLELRENAEFMEPFLSRDAQRVLALAGPKLHDSTDFVKLAIRKSGHALKYASKRLRDSKEIVQMACERATGAFEHATMRLRDDEAYVLELTKSNPYLLKHASKRLKDNYVFYNKVMKQGKTPPP